MSLYERLAWHATRWPRCAALVWPTGTLDYEALLAQVDAAIRMLREARVDVLALDLDNGPAWVVLDIAALQMGICLVPLPPFFSAAQLRHVMNRTGAQAVVSDNPVRLRERLGHALQDTASLLPVGGQRLDLIRTLASAGRCRMCASASPKMARWSSTVTVSSATWASTRRRRSDGRPAMWANWTRRAFSTCVAGYVEEELGHQEWILNDIRACGGDAEQVRREPAGMAAELMVAYAYHTIDRGNPARPPPGANHRARKPTS